MAELAGLLEGMTAAQKAHVLDQFMGTWAANGFGTMTKKDTELLLFRCLGEGLGEQAPKTVYDWAHLLRITPQKVKSLMLESHMRFGEHELIAWTPHLQEYFGQIHAIQPRLHTDGTLESLSEMTVSFVIEDPVAQMELENDLKAVGTYLDFHRNREVVTLRFADFLRVVARYVPEEDKLVLDRIVSARLEDLQALGDINSKLEAAEYASKSEPQKALAFISVLANAFLPGEVTALLNHLETILRAQQ